MPATTWTLSNTTTVRLPFSHCALQNSFPVGTSCCNLLDPISSEEEDSESEPGEVDELCKDRRIVSKPLAEADPLSAWLGVSWLIMYLMFILFLLYKRKPGPVQ